MAERFSVLAPLRYDVFRSIWTANLASSLGGLIQGVGAAWLMTSITNAVDLVALVQASTTLPFVLLALLGGAIADSFNRRRVMIAAQSFMLVVSLALTACAYLGVMTPWLLLAFTFLIGCGTALNNPSWQASVGDVVERSDLPAAVTLNSVGYNLSRSVGPAIGGAIVAAAGAAAAFAVNAVSYIPLLVVLLRWKPQNAPSSLPREAMGPAIMAGLRYIAMSPNVGRVLVRSFVFGVGASAMLALLPLIAANRLAGGPLLYGTLYGAFGLGAIGGAVIGTRLRASVSSETVVRIAFTGFAAGTAIAGVSTNPWLTALAVAVSGACWVMALSLFNVLVQLSTPRWVVGRALSIYNSVAFGGMALGAWLFGLIGEQQGIETAMLYSAGLLLAGALIGLWLGLPQQRALDLDPANRWKEPSIALDLEPRSGPIVVTVEFAIRPTDVPLFLELMQERKRIRQRDGARHWVLMRDLADPELWTESYHLPTWVEYVRHNLRATNADVGLRDKLRALHRRDAPPVVRRHIERPPSWFSSVAARATIVEPP